MLDFIGGTKQGAFCDGVSRRNFLRIGGLGLGGMAGGVTLPQLLQQEAAAGQGGSHKSVIMIYLCGGPPHQDMYDIKVDAPAEVRGDFSPIKTNVPGIEICEHLPKMARIMDKLAPIRSMVDCQPGHEGYQCFTGHTRRNEPGGGWPAFGSAVGHYEGAVHPGAPPFVSLCYTTKHTPYNEPNAGFLGLGASSFRPTGPARDDMQLQGVSAARLQGRQTLLTRFDQFRRHWDASGAMRGMDAFTERAMGVLTSSQMFDALDISKESPETRARYGEGDLSRPQGDAAPHAPQNFLIARRLVEAGARVVTLNHSFWDFHGDNFGRAKRELPIFDQALSALVEDLHQRGLADDVTVVAWGEFGRTPTINKNAGRDHWPRVSCALLAGGGMRTGQVLGATDRLGGEAVDRGVTFAEVFATLYYNLGINLDSQRLFDFRGRPNRLVNANVRPLHELV